MAGPSMAGFISRLLHWPEINPAAQREALVSHSSLQPPWRVWLARTPGAYYKSPANPLDPATSIQPVRATARILWSGARPHNDRGAPPVSEAASAHRSCAGQAAG
jgi:hypothetical protein